MLTTKDEQELAELLNRLNDSDAEYQKYFDWKQRPFAPAFHDKYSKCMFSRADCRLCQWLAEKSEKVISLPRKKDFALQFLDENGKGDNPYVEVEDRDDVFHFSHNFTLAAWIYGFSMKDNRIIDKNRAGTISGMNFDTVEVGKRFWLRLCLPTGCYIGKHPLTPRVWYHVGVTFEEGRITFYLNGKADRQKRIDWIEPVNNQLPLRIGAAATGGVNWQGMIDEVSIWDVALSPAEYFKLMFHHLSGDEPGLMGYWQFNEGEGSQTLDKSRHNRHARLNLPPSSWVISREKPMHFSDHI
eukprot:TRINITY_DN7468_c0_g1_i1.p2 TRINITY_DN7468_c0_g1~~TRINITY_DN7468_c0_g1_i1.p2  ORF type:complete len:299 (+),score=74.30 TRINITY_DN7468_c0_g1_i1:1527-2423(+)